MEIYPKEEKLVKDERLKELYTYKADKALQALDQGNIRDAAGVHISFGDSSQIYEQNVCLETVNLASISADTRIHIIARRDDVNLIGAKISAAAVSVTAARDIHLNSAQNKQQVNNSAASTAWAIGSNIISNQNNQQEHGSVLTNTVSLINADSAVQLHAGHDVNMIGAKVSSGKIAVRAGHDLNLVSLQDIDSYNADSSSAGFDRNIDKAVNADDLLLSSSNAGKTKASYNSVTNQTGIFAGKGGFAIFVGGNTQLQGSVIASDAPDDSNRLSTDTLSFSDIDNVAEYASSGHGITYASQSGEKGSEIEKGFTPSLLPTIKDKAGSTTKAAISMGTDRIEVRSNPGIDLSAICTDTKEALNVLPKIFDKQAVQEKQELANLFGQMAFEAVGEIARSYQAKAYDKFIEAARINDPEKKAKLTKEADDILSEWGQGGTNKVALHALVGGIMSDLAGHDFTAGAVAAGLNEALQKELGEWEEKNRAANQWVSLAIGAVLDQAAGSGSNIGAVAALSGTKYNWDHTGHNYIIDQLSGHSDDDKKILREYNRTYDTLYQLDCHAMPPWPGEDAEKVRRKIIDTCGLRLANAISCKFYGSKRGMMGYLWNFVIAIHIVADDRSHRQINGTLFAHKAVDKVAMPGGEEPYTVATCDNMFNDFNWHRFKDAINAANEVNNLFHSGTKQTTNDEIRTKLEKLFPRGPFPEVDFETYRIIVKKDPTGIYRHQRKWE